jgi:hypothetical protein
MTKAKPPDKAGRAENAARPIDNEVLILVQKLKQVNSIAPGWAKQAWCMFAKWQRTENPKHLVAFANQVRGIFTRLNLEAVR